MKIVILLMCCLLNFAFSFAQQYVPCAPTPTLDGMISPGEWSLADSVFIELPNDALVKVAYMHDGENFHFLFAGALESFNVRFPEIVIDVDYQLGDDFLEDDWWFHVSATDCSFQGEHSNYTNCELEPEDWAAYPNYGEIKSNVDTVEIQIPFETIGLDDDVVAMAFILTNTFDAWEFWPYTAVMDYPSTWETFKLLPCGTTIPPAYEMEQSFSIQWIGEDQLQITQDFNRIATCSIRDLTGKIVFDAAVTGRQVVNTAAFETGIYLIQVGNQSQKLFIN